MLNLIFAASGRSRLNWNDLYWSIFEYDPRKAAANFRKHGVSFDEAVTIFDDPHSSTLPDDQHSITESRLITIGMSSRGRLLFVVYTEIDLVIRIIGARIANLAEKRQYEENT